MLQWRQGPAPDVYDLGSLKRWGDPYIASEMGLGGPHITRDNGTGVPISRGSPYRAYTGLSLRESGYARLATTHD